MSKIENCEEILKSRYNREASVKKYGQAQWFIHGHERWNDANFKVFASNVFLSSAYPKRNIHCYKNYLREKNFWEERGIFKDKYSLRTAMENKFVKYPR